MAVKFNENGTIECNSIKLNWLQARNMIADNSCGNMSGVWKFGGNAGYTFGGTSNEEHGYKSYRCIDTHGKNSYSRQFLTKGGGESDLSIIELGYPDDGSPEGHSARVYYLSFYIKTAASLSEYKIGLNSTKVSGDDNGFIFPILGADNDPDIPATKTFPNWTKVSLTFWIWNSYRSDSSYEYIMYAVRQIDGSPYNVSGQGAQSFGKDGAQPFINCIECKTSTDTPVYTCKYILIDLTDTFNLSINNLMNYNTIMSELGKYASWCDENIREHEVIQNWGCKSKNVATNSYNNGVFKMLNGSANYNYLQLNSNWEPRDYILMCNCKGSASQTISGMKFEGYSGFCAETVNDGSAGPLPVGKYYLQYDAMFMSPYMNNITRGTLQYLENKAGSIAYNGKWDFDPELKVIDPTSMNRGGGMRDWHRYGGVINHISNDNITSCAFGAAVESVSETSTEQYARYTNICLSDIASNVNIYNQYNGTSLTVDDVDASWCNRWIDGRSSPIIHIRSMDTIKISFNENYDIICNDIVVSPEFNGIKFDYSTGTIYCRGYELRQENTYGENWQVVNENEQVLNLTCGTGTSTGSGTFETAAYAVAGISSTVENRISGYIEYHSASLDTLANPTIIRTDFTNLVLNGERTIDSEQRWIANPICKIAKPTTDNSLTVSAAGFSGGTYPTYYSTGCRKMVITKIEHLIKE